MSQGMTERAHRRRRCGGEVVLHSLDSGPAIRGRLVDLGGGGARVAVDRPPPAGAVVAMTLGGAGRRILGRVASRGGGVIGIQFGWDIAEASPASAPGRGPWSWLRSLGRGATRRPTSRPAASPTAGRR